MILLNGQSIPWFKFPGGEIQVTLKPLDCERATLTWKPSSSDDILLLMLTVNALKHQGCTDIILDCLYLPYARQDRVCSPRQAYSLEVMVKLLDSLGVSDIRFWDLHNSDQTLELFQHTCVHETEIHDIFSFYNILDGFDLSNLKLCAPDHGAREKIDKIVNQFQMSEAIHFDKDRCPDTGKILGLSPNRFNDDYDGYNILVVDDICDGGSTFIEVAKQLRAHTGEDLYLYVTHGIFSNGFEELHKYYKHIFCHTVRDCISYPARGLTILRGIN